MFNLGNPAKFGKPSFESNDWSKGSQVWKQEAKLSLE